MQFPARSYYHLDEVAGAWGVQLRDLLDFAVGGHLQLSILVAAVQVQTDGEALMSLTGLQPLLSQDVIEVVISGTARLKRFASGDRRYPLPFAQDEPAIIIGVDHLLVSSREKLRFEQEAGAQGKANGAPVDDFRVEGSFTRVTCAGRIYTFGPAQAAVVRQLYEGATAGTPWRSGKDLLAGADTRVTKLVDLFKRKVDPSWRDLIESDGRGMYRLKVPAGVALSNSRAYRRIRRLFRARRT
jgi:hypothetical protein